MSYAKYNEDLKILQLIGGVNDKVQVITKKETMFIQEVGKIERKSGCYYIHAWKIDFIDKRR